MAVEVQSRAQEGKTLNPERSLNAYCLTSLQRPAGHKGPLLFICCLLIQAQCSESAVTVNCSRPDVESLIVALDTVLNRNTHRPVLSLSTPTNVSIDFSLIGILGVEWDIEFLSWDPEQCGAQRISVPRTKLWTPDIVISEFMDEDRSPDTPYVYLDHNGTVFDDRPVRVVSSCNLDIYAFPFDVQNCSLTFGSYLHFSSDIQMTLGTEVSDILKESQLEMQTMGEWELITITGTHSTLQLLDYEYSEVIFYIVMRRQPTLYVVNLLVPSCFLLTVDLFSFLLPPQSVDRSSFKMTLILGYTVFLLIMNDLLPVTGTRTPLINVFFSICLALMVASLLETVFITNILYSSNHYPMVPHWVRVIILQYLARVVCLSKTPTNRVTVTLNPAVQEQLEPAAWTSRESAALPNMVPSKCPVSAEKMEATACPSVKRVAQSNALHGGAELCCEQLILEELRKLSRDLLAIRLKVDQRLKGNQNSEEWVQIGNVIDRLLFGLYLFFITVSFITIIIIWAKWNCQ
ncbi:hypothetical protein AAFF_G00003840 [Aldrovandia affinis]|uniref:5-hydroxytryptamine receptor 3A-like n=1 Tax=Aldrovandia affinis TaxID=143900 RepID=A0AAD7TDI8_9TELE|nr:hypothetical protein AAFF_G00003840 [Aldrovandia affinis]